jgi:endonuclease G, mitochondrial
MAKLSSDLNASLVAPSAIGDAVVVGDTSLTGNRNLTAGFPMDSRTQTKSVNDLMLSRNQYVISFSSKSKVPVWTSWQVVDKDLGTTERADEFESDQLLNNFLVVKKMKLGVTPDDYTGSCFDRGHQAPAGDRSDTHTDSEATFFMSNMAPQTAFLNRIIWKDLETYSRKLVTTDGRRLQIYAGTILRDGREGIGRNKDIQVPESFYKIVAVFKDQTTTTPMGYIAVIMPNVTSDGLDPVAEHTTACSEQRVIGKLGHLSRTWRDYVVPLSVIQAKASVDFPFLANVTPL